MLSNHLINQGLLFNFLTKDKIQSVNLYFEDHPNANKYSKKRSKLECSFIKTNKGLFAISNHVVGAGVEGRVKIAKNITTNQLVAVKIKLHHIFGVEDYENAMNESYILYQLRQLYASALRWSENSIELDGSELPDASKFWFNKYCTDEKYRFIQYNLKFYIFMVLFDGITLAKYIKNIQLNKQQLTTEKKVEIIIKILEKLEILHKKNIVHGDLNLHNILILENPDGKIDINLIDFGFAATLNKGIARYKSFDFHRKHITYVPPECDRQIVCSQIIPELRDAIGQLITELQFQMIIDWAETGYGFLQPASDLYSLCWNIYHFINVNQDPRLNENLTYYSEQNPFCRGSLQFLLAKYRAKLDQVREQRIIQELVNVVLENQHNETQEQDLTEESIKRNNVAIIAENCNLNPVLIYSFSNNSFDNSILDDIANDHVGSPKITEQLVVSTTEKLQLLNI